MSGKVCKQWERVDTRSANSALLAILALAGLSVGCSGGSASGQQPQGLGGVPVKIQVVSAMPVSDSTEYVATLKSRDSAVIMPEVEGRVTQIYARSGERVSAGTFLDAD